MVPTPASPNTTKQFDAEAGKPVAISPGITRLTAPNANAFTYTGTNSFLIGGDNEVAVIDPGPDDDRHLDALMHEIGARRVVALILTHTHRDHCALARRLANKTGAPLWFGGQHRLSRPRRRFEPISLARSSDWSLVPDRVLNDGERIEVAGIGLIAHATPGHCANHLAFGVAGTPVMFSGDHVMGWNSTLVAVPDGSMADYMQSLDTCLALDYDHYLPAHGGPIANARRYVEHLKARRNQRNRQILAALENGTRTVRQLVGIIYPDLPLANKIAAAMTLTAHLEFLADRGKVLARWRPWGTRYALAC